ncbi:MAG: MmgE/PrpD family protein [Chloroflexi bacterium]|nr:MmgE/PrpD family protein [Chloroflexota bacterium]
MGVTEELVQHITHTEFNNLDAETVEHAKKRIIDVIGCSFAGTKSPVFPRIIDLVREWGGKPESTLLALRGGKLPAHNAALANSVLASALDFDPLHSMYDGKTQGGHISGTTVPAALAAAEQRNASGKQLITALVIGDDITARLMAASEYSPSKGKTTGWDPESTIATFGTTGIAASLWDLDQRETHNALGIALNEAAGSIETLHEKSHCYKLNQGFGARNGILAVELASKGFIGLKEPFTGEYGYAHLYCRVFKPELISKGLGEKYYSDHVIKPYPANLFIQPGIACALELVRKNKFNAEDITEVVVTLFVEKGHEIIIQPFKLGDDPHMDANWNLSFNVASVLLRKEMTLENVSDEAIRDPRIMTLTQKTRIVTKAPPKSTDVEIKVTLKNGKSVSATLDMPIDEPDYPTLSLDLVKEKFRNNLAYFGGMTKANSEKMLQLLENLEKVKDVGEVFKLLA